MKSYLLIFRWLKVCKCARKIIFVSKISQLRHVLKLSEIMRIPQIDRKPGNFPIWSIMKI